MTPVTIGEQSFPSKTELERHIRSVVAKYADHADIAEADHKFLLALLSRHRWAAEKIGTGVKCFWIQPNIYRKRGFWLERLDGSKTDWSWVKCVTSPDHISDVQAAFRNAIRPQIIEAQNVALASHATCSITGEPLNRENIHIDHEEPLTFENLVKLFVDTNAISLQTIKVEGYEDREQTKCFVDPSLAENWKRFHRANAKLRAVTNIANLKAGKTKIKTKTIRNMD